ncbi:hypothetical protein CDO87_21345 [Sagittula sp. P11]|nr:hypothetical protein CDO87_21345 [Sagittula sp. P11]
MRAAWHPVSAGVAPVHMPAALGGAVWPSGMDAEAGGRRLRTFALFENGAFRLNARNDLERPGPTGLGGVTLYRTCDMEGMS